MCCLSEWKKNIIHKKKRNLELIGASPDYELILEVYSLSKTPSDSAFVFVFKEINSFIKQVCIKLMKGDTNDFHNFGFYFNFRLHFKIY